MWTFKIEVHKYYSCGWIKLKRFLKGSYNLKLKMSFESQHLLQFFNISWNVSVWHPVYLQASLINSYIVTTSPNMLQKCYIISLIPNSSLICRELIFCSSKYLFLFYVFMCISVCMYECRLLYTPEESIVSSGTMSN